MVSRISINVVAASHPTTASHCTHYRSLPARFARPSESDRLKAEEEGDPEDSWTGHSSVSFPCHHPRTSTTLHLLYGEEWSLHGDYARVWSFDRVGGPVRKVLCLARSIRACADRRRTRGVGWDGARRHPLGVCLSLIIVLLPLLSPLPYCTTSSTTTTSRYYRLNQ